MSAINDPNVGIAIAIAVAIHNIQKALLYLFLFSLQQVIEGKPLNYPFIRIGRACRCISSFLLLMPFLTDVMFGIVFAGVAGIMVFISLDELLPVAKDMMKHICRCMV